MVMHITETSAVQHGWSCARRKKSLRRAAPDGRRPGAALAKSTRSASPTDQKAHAAPCL